VTDGAACAVTDLLSEARSGDPAAFAGLVRRHQRAVYSLALRMLWDRHKAEDLAQDVFMQLYRKLAHLLEADPGVPAEPAGGDPLLQRRLRALLAQLPAPARAVLLLRYQEDLDPVEIASTLDMPVNTVKSHLKRSLASLREQLGEGFESAAAPEGGPIT
jgi:RNA polymerase sigma-70 factor (ECF subfamily)